ncbi:MAG TPA: hypothetical protein VGG20_23735 [Thermoanaerobaculia bacterium]
MKQGIGMTENLAHIITIVVTTVVTTLAVENRQRIIDAFFQLLSSKPQVHKFEKLVKETYQKYPAKRPHYYCRENYKPREKESPTYHFFIRDDVEIQEFMAFLLPSLDFGHGRKSLPIDVGLQHKFIRHWDEYLRRIAVKVKNASNTPNAKRVRSSVGHKESPRRPRGSRIVFFDKDLLLLFLFNYDWIYEANDGSDTPRSQFAKAIIEYAADIVVIQNRMKLYEAIECRYIAESEVRATDYYDFGLYTIENTQIVYAPIPKKDSTQKIWTEKIYIGDTARQKRAIKEFVEDYENLWYATYEECGAEGNKSAITEEALSEPRENFYYNLNYLTSEFFERIYIDRIYRILHEKSGFSIPPVDVPGGHI